MKIAVDVMGGDFSPMAQVLGAIEASKQRNFCLVLVGDEEQIKSCLPIDIDSTKIEVVNAAEFIDNDESPTLAIRRKKDSSMVKSLNLLRDNEVDGLLSSGSTGALLAGGMLIVKRMVGVQRAALVSIYPTTKGMSIIVDAGANVDTTPNTLLQFALMANIYYKSLFNMPNPRVGLLNIGKERNKGNQLTIETYQLLEKSGLNFIGNIEARDVPFGGADIIVSDGFSGNITLKLTEGMAYAMMNRLKETMNDGIRSKIGALLLKPALKKMIASLDYRDYGAVPLLGLQKPVFKAHGSSDEVAIKNGLLRLVDFIEQDTIEKVKKSIEEDENGV